jgi:hypothetical protein
VVWDRRGDERIGDLLKVEIIEAHPQTLIGKVSSPIMV